MKKLLLKAVVLTAFLSVLLTGCGGTGGNTPGGNGREEQGISGELTTSETWPGKDSNGDSITYYIDGTYTIKDSGSLTIEEGAIVKFGPNGKITVNRTSLTATGVIFTSCKDERGRKIKDGEPAPGDWKQVYIYGGTGVFTNCEFSYGGSGCSTLEIVKNSTLGKARINNCSFKNNSGTKAIPDNDSGIKAALKFGSTCVYDANNNSVTNSTFDNNVWPLSMPADFYIASNNTFNNNEYNYVYINDSDISGTTTWEHLNIPYIFVDNNNLSIKANATLTIKGGVQNNLTTVCFTNGGISIVQDGTLIVEDYVKFTNCDKSPTINFKGIRCATSRKWKEGGSTKTTGTIYLLSNESKNITIEKDEIPSDYLENAHKTAFILDINNYEKFKYDES